jgi:hypothetical protein
VLTQEGTIGYERAGQTVILIEVLREHYPENSCPLAVRREG